MPAGSRCCARWGCTLPPHRAPAAISAEPRSRSAAARPPSRSTAPAACRCRAPAAGRRRDARLGRPAGRRAACRACGLCESRQNTVFGTGPATAEWLIVGEAPDEEEDLQGEPFAGRGRQAAGQHAAHAGPGPAPQRLHRQRAQVPPARQPQPGPGGTGAVRAVPAPPGRAAAAAHHPGDGALRRAGAAADQEPIGRLRGRVHRYHDVPVVVTYHPAYLLRNLPDKAKAWADLCLAMDLLEDRVARLGRRHRPEGLRAERLGRVVDAAPAA
jgi:uracil-DNA glycosylase